MSETPRYVGGPFDGQEVPANLAAKDFVLVGKPTIKGWYEPDRDFPYLWVWLEGHEVQL